VHRGRLPLGVGTDWADSEALLARAAASARPIVMTSHAVPGRLSFRAQTAAIAALMQERPGLFAV